MPTWLKDAVFYEIYPQTFYDTNADGIGDLEGIIQKLDYIKELGCNALWINPFFDSPFMDAGYDVRDYKKVAERYGTNEDAYRLMKEAHKRGIKVLLDLVAGHTSDEHEWFRFSKQAEKNKYSDRYVWTNGAFVGIKDHPYMAGMSDRDGAYMLNFFAPQPALNYGWLECTELWMSSIDSQEAKETVEDIKDVIRFWLDHGADGFRCDMADSLVKNDDQNKSATAKIWADIREMLDRDYPEAAIVSEWSNPEQAINAGRFHMDFYLDHWHNGYNTLLRDYETDGGDHSYFLKNGNGNICRFLDDYMPKYMKVKKNGYISMFTCNHDTPRPSNNLSQEELKIAYAFILTMPGVPFVYYGDEIGMRYIKGMCSKEGGFHRTGSRTPMQWSNEKNKGFSTAKEDKLYLNVDEHKDAPTVAQQKEDKNSLYHITKSLIALRHHYEDLQADADFMPVYIEENMPFIYRRGKLLVAIYPQAGDAKINLSILKDYKIIYQLGMVSLVKNELGMQGGSFAVLELK